MRWLDKFDHPINLVRGVVTRFMMPTFSSWDFRGCNELFRHGRALIPAMTSSRHDGPYRTALAGATAARGRICKNAPNITRWNTDARKVIAN
jgi:hypothetical protein